MKKKTCLFTSLVFAATACALIFSSYSNDNFLFQHGYAANLSYTLELDKNDSVVVLNEEANYLERNTEFAYHNVKESNNGHIIIEKNGYIKNETPIVGGTDLTVNYSFVRPTDLSTQNDYGFGQLFVVFDTHPIDNPFSYDQSNVLLEGESSNKISIPSGTKYIAIATYNTCDINKIVITYNCGDNGYEIDNSDFTLNLIGTNDIHGQTLSNSSSAGLSNASKKINDLKSNYKYNLLIDQGDIYQGSIDSYQTNGELMDEFLLKNGYDTTLIGNHEWDYSFEGKNDNGIEDHLEYFKNTHVSLLGNNILHNGNDVEWNVTMKDKYGNDLRGCKIIERHGVQIGIIGMAGDYGSSISADLIPGYTFAGDKASIKSRTITASNALKELGADFIILSIHAGTYGTLLDTYDLELSSGDYVDLVLESHSHSGYDYVDNYGVHHIQAKGYLQSLYNVEINFSYNTSSNKWEHTVNSATFYSGSTMVANGEDEMMNDIHYWYSNRIFGYNKNKVLAINAPSISSNELKTFTATTIFEACNDEFGNTYDLIYGGGYLNLRGTQGITGGKVTYGDINTLLPFDNDIQVCSGLFKEFKQRFLSSTSYVGYTPSSLTENDGVYSYNGKTISDNDTVYFATDSYNTQYWLYGNGVGYFKSYKVVANYTAINGKFVRDIVADRFADTYLSVIDLPSKISADNVLSVALGNTKTISASVDKGSDCLFYTTSNENVAVVNGLTGEVKGKNIGSCTVTIYSLLDKTIYTTVEVNVTEVEEVISKYGTLDKPLTVQQAISLYNEECSTSGAATAEKVYVVGYVNIAPGTVNSTYVTTFYISDDASNTEKTTSLCIYSASYGGTYGTSAPKLNSKVVLYGYLKNYSGNRQMTKHNNEYAWVVA